MPLFFVIDLGVFSHEQLSSTLIYLEFKKRATCGWRTQLLGNCLKLKDISKAEAHHTCPGINGRSSSHRVHFVPITIDPIGWTALSHLFLAQQQADWILKEFPLGTGHLGHPSPSFTWTCSTMFWMDAPGLPCLRLSTACMWTTKHNSITETTKTTKICCRFNTG